MNKNMSKRLWVSLFLGLYLMLGTALTAGADDLSDVMRKSIEKTFPECEIKLTEEERWKGEVVTEVELIAKNGIHYEVYISNEGKILKIEEDDDFSWFRSKSKK